MKRCVHCEVGYRFYGPGLVQSVEAFVTARILKLKPAKQLVSLKTLTTGITRKAQRGLHHKMDKLS